MALGWQVTSLKEMLSIGGRLLNKAKGGGVVRRQVLRRNQAKHFKWALCDWILDEIVNTKFIDVAQVANAARNMEILKHVIGLQELVSLVVRHGHMARDCPRNECKYSDHEYQNCPLHFDDKIRFANLLPLEMSEFNISLGGKLIQLMHTTMVPEQVKTMKIQAGVQVSRPGELRRHLQLWKCFGRLYFVVIVLDRNIDCGSDKSPGPDGFTFGFYRRYWDTIEKDVVDAVSYFFSVGMFPKGGNASFIALIPKMQDAKVVENYRPISLIGSVYKIIAKILANHLVGVLGDLIHEVQSAFIANRQILDGPFILDELIHWCKSKKKQSMIFKVDFEKAYDSVRWDYLDDVLNKFGFGSKWRAWI
ncbi:RNA-directed DNA polymerase, eukaryota, reverse transcriptase zinc-binding domain protein [Tanacetum coccineum]|uniref:RNA-directed DNA polymerase, eukaryota, reverse transcriptase zinc-binding domain protein n=1 Tax=Tanacetum coccineum TaxID=301880 RepID=A0ABQ5ELQ7_9ASTR